jgi:hypothetical protein
MGSRRAFWKFCRKQFIVYKWTLTYVGTREKRSVIIEAAVTRAVCAVQLPLLRNLIYVVKKRNVRSKLQWIVCATSVAYELELQSTLYLLTLPKM